MGSVNDLYDVYKRFCQGHMLQYIHLGNGRIGIYILTLGQKGHKSYQRMCTERITTSFDVKVFSLLYILLHRHQILWSGCKEGENYVLRHKKKKKGKRKHFIWKLIDSHDENFLNTPTSLLTSYVSLIILKLDVTVL